MRRLPPFLLRPVTAEDGVDEYGHGYTVVAVCHFGHAAEVLNGLAQAKAASDKEFYQLRARLRCGKCGVRMPKIQVYRGLR